MKRRVLVALIGAVLLTVGAAPDGRLAERRAAVEAMTPAEKEQLLRHEQEFLAMAPDRQERLRTLHREIEAHPDSAQLRAVMERYTQWVAKLEPEQRRAEEHEEDVDDQRDVAKQLDIDAHRPAQPAKAGRGERPERKSDQRRNHQRDGRERERHRQSLDDELQIVDQQRHRYAPTANGLRRWRSSRLARNDRTTTRPR